MGKIIKKRRPIGKRRLIGLALAGWLLAALWLGLPLRSRAAVELKSFTATTQADGSILLRWVTGTELDTSAFRVYRANTATGPWDTIINEQDSRSNGENDTVYEFVDTAVAVGSTYYYMLEEVEVPSAGGINRYMDFIRSATAGQPGAPTSTPTATRTPTVTATQGASPTATRTAGPTATSTATATAAPTDVPTATRQFTNTPPPQGQPSAMPTTPSPPETARPTTPTAPLPPAAVASPTAAVGASPGPSPAASPTRLQPGAPTAPPPVASPPPIASPPQPPSVPIRGAGPTAAASPTPAVFAPKATGQPLLRGTATRPAVAAPEAAETSRAGSWWLALGGGAALLAGLIAGIALLLWRRHHA